MNIKVAALTVTQKLYNNEFLAILILIWFFTFYQQSFSYVGMGLTGLNQYLARINVSCLRTQRREARTPGPLSHWASSAQYGWGIS